MIPILLEINQEDLINLWIIHMLVLQLVDQWEVVDLWDLVWVEWVVAQVCNLAVDFDEKYE